MAVTTSVTRKISPNVCKSWPKWFHEKNDRFWRLYKKCLRIWEIWANWLLPKALKSCPKSNKSPNMVTLVTTLTLEHFSRRKWTTRTAVVLRDWCIQQMALSVSYIVHEKNITLAVCVYHLTSRFTMGPILIMLISFYLSAPWLTFVWQLCSVHISSIQTTLNWH